MIFPERPANEKERLQAVYDLEILDTSEEPVLNDLVELAADICGVPYSFVSIIDENRQWFKAKHGCNITGSERDLSYCGHAILNPQELMLVEDASKDERFSENLLGLEEGSRIRFYAGMPIRTEDDFPLGTLCVIDHKTHTLTPKQKEHLKKLARQCECALAKQKRDKELKKMKHELSEHNLLVKDFAGLVSHSLKMPIANMVLTVELLNKKLAANLDESEREHLLYLKDSGLQLSSLVSDIIDYYDNDRTLDRRKEEFDLYTLLERSIDLLEIRNNVEINFPEENSTLHSNKIALLEIFTNLFKNALKFNDKDNVKIDVEFSESLTHYLFSVSDNGIGILLDKQEKIFDLFYSGESDDRYGTRGNGVGLSISKKLIDLLGGNIYVSSIPGEGSTFSFSVKK